MKKKIYFISTAIIQIMAFVYTIITASKLIQSFLEAANMYPEAMRERIQMLCQNSGNIFIYVMAFVGIICNILIIRLALRNRVLKKRGGFIALNVITFLVAQYSLIQLIAVINIIMVLILKREKEEDLPDPKEELPVLEKENITNKKILGSIVLIVVYFSQFAWSRFIPDNKLIKGITSVIFYVVLIIISLIVFKDLYRDNFKVYREKFKTYISNLAPKMGLFYLVYFAVAIIVALLAQNTVSANQSSVEALPVYLLAPLAIIYAPIVEEAIFRGSLRRFIKNDMVFIVISAITFGLLHTIFSEETLYNALVMAIPYSMLGGFMAYLYVKTNNIFTNMTFHAFQNTLAVIITILMKGL